MVWSNTISYFYLSEAKSNTSVITMSYIYCTRIGGATFTFMGFDLYRDRQSILIKYKK